MNGELDRRVRERTAAAEQDNAAPAPETAERLRAKRGADESGERLRLLVDSIRHRAILMLEPDGHIATWSAGARKLMAYAPDEIIGAHFSVLYAEDDRRTARPGHALEQAELDGHHEEEGWRLRKRGAKFWAETMLTALRDNAGELRGFGMVVRDRSERRQADAENSLIGQVFAMSSDLILVVDRDGKFIQVSPSSLALLGYAPGELVGRNALELAHAEDLESARGEMRLARRGPAARNFECRYVRKDGSLVTLGWKCVWSEPEQQHFFIGRDLSERMAAEETLRRAQRLEAIGRLAGGMAHDFNNLLGVIIGNLDLARPLVERSGEAGELVGESMAAALKGADLTRRLLAFARQQPLEPEHVRIGEGDAGARQVVERAPSGAGETVLAVEDNRALRRLVVRQLKELGYRVIEADNAAAALAVLESRTVSVLFSDIVMPGAMNGVELARLALARWPSVKVILASGFPEAKIAQDAGPLATSVRLIGKPYRRQDLASALREALSGHAASSEPERSFQ
jgi:PAS domain S-box-containing protein